VYNSQTYKRLKKSSQHRCVKNIPEKTFQDKHQKRKLLYYVIV